MSDISDLHGVFPTALRWNAEFGVLGYSVFDEATGERTVKEIELGSAKAKFALDLATRERGYGLIRTGVYDMRLTPVGVPAPEWPGDEYKPSIGCWTWNPVFGELRLETNQATLVRAVTGVWDRCRTFKEASAGLEPVLHFIAPYEQFYKTIGKSFFAPQINIVGWIERDKVPTFAMRPATVKPPVALDNQVLFAQLEKPTSLQKQVAEKLAGKGGARKKGTTAKPSATGDSIDDEIPF